MNALILMLLLAFCVQAAYAVEAGTPANYAAWTASSLEKILKDSPPQPLKPAEVSAARGEHEAFQIVLRAESEPVRGITISASGLSSGEHRLPASCLTFYTQSYIHLPALGNDYPDALPPHKKPFDVAAGDTQPVWVDINVPRTARAGTYTGSVKIASSNAPEKTVTVNLRVYDFELPVQPKIATAFGLWSLKFLEFGHGLPANDPEAARLHEKYYEFLLDHGISTFYSLPGEPLSEKWVKYVTDPRVTSFALEYSRDEKKLRQILEKIRSLGVWDKAYFYFVDEPGTEEDYNRLKDGYEFLRGIDPKVNIVSPYFQNPPFAQGKTVYDLLAGYINIWCFNTGFYDGKALSERRAAGDRIWNYVCCGPLRPYANFLIDFACLEHRMLFWQNYLYNVTGLLYWNTIYWNPEDGMDDPWTNPVTMKVRPKVYGDGSLLYPGSKVGVDGPVSSIRLEMIRDGIEDYSYLWLLEQNIGREAVLPYVQKLAVDWREFTRDPALFKSVRDEIGRAIEEAGSRS